MTESQVEDFRQYFDIGFRDRLTTPRMAKRFSNALMFALPILRGETNPIDVIAIEGTEHVNLSFTETIFRFDGGKLQELDGDNGRLTSYGDGLEDNARSSFGKLQDAVVIVDDRESVTWPTRS